MALNTEVPAWLTDEIRWRRTIGDEGTRMVNNIVNMGSTLLQQKGQREALAMQADEQKRMHEDMEQLPVWLQQHDGDPNGYTPKSRWGQVTSAQAWQRKYQEGLMDARKTQAEAMLEWRKSQADNQSVEGKERAKVVDQFNKDLSAIPTEDAESAGEKAAILALPKQGGLPSAEAFRRLGELQKKHPPKTKPSSMTNEGKNIELLKRLKESGDIEGAALVENILKSRGHMGTDKPPEGKLTEVQKSRLKSAEADVAASNKALAKADADLAAAGNERSKAAATAVRDKAYQDNITAREVLEDLRKKHEQPVSAAPAKAPKGATVPVSPSHDEAADIAARATPSVPKVQSQADIDKAIDLANKAIANGKDPAEVRKRLKEMGIPIKE